MDLHVIVFTVFLIISSIMSIYVYNLFLFLQWLAHHIETGDYAKALQMCVQDSDYASVHDAEEAKRIEWFEHACATNDVKQVYIYIHIYVYIYVYIHIYICMFVCLCMYI